MAHALQRTLPSSWGSARSAGTTPTARGDGAALRRPATGRVDMRRMASGRVSVRRTCPGQCPPARVGGAVRNWPTMPGARRMPAWEDAMHDPDPNAAPAANAAPHPLEHLLDLARAAVIAAVEGRPAPVPDPRARAELAVPCGRVRDPHGRRDHLRGCMGTLGAEMPLGEAVVRAAGMAATRDPRFPPVAAPGARRDPHRGERARPPAPARRPRRLRARPRRDRRGGPRPAGAAAPAGRDRDGLGHDRDARRRLREGRASLPTPGATRRRGSWSSRSSGRRGRS